MKRDYYSTIIAKYSPLQRLEYLEKHAYGVAAAARYFQKRKRIELYLEAHTTFDGIMKLIDMTLSRLTTQEVTELAANQYRELGYEVQILDGQDVKELLGLGSLAGAERGSDLVPKDGKPEKEMLH